MNLQIRQASQVDINLIESYLEDFYLDKEKLSPAQFLIAEVDENLAGFGRIKSYSSFYELSSLGVLEEYRNKGVGEKLIKHLIDTVPADEVWITTRIADYFQKFGFQEVDNPPEELKQKYKTRQIY